MPALTNSRLGSSSSSDAEGTTVWPREPKNSNHRRLISAVSIRLSSPSAAVSPQPRRVVHEVGRLGGRQLVPALVEAERVAQLDLPLDHAGPDLVGEVAQAVAEADGLAGQALRAVGPRGLLHLAGHVDAGRRPES